MSLKINIISLFLLSSLLCITSCSEGSSDGMIIVTQALGNDGKPDYSNGTSWRYIEKTRLVAIEPDQPEQTSLLTESFYSARSPEISYDGEKLLFAAQQNQGDPWQIWEMNLKNLKARQITSSQENAIDPSYLPGNRLVFTRSTPGDSLKAGHALFTCSLDGSDLKRITFNPHAYFAPMVMKDGRIISISRQIYPVQNSPVLMASRPDGTKSELFYKGDKGNELVSKAWETANGKIVFIETDSSDGKGSIVSINYNRPLHSRVNLSASTEGDFYFALPLHDNELLVSYRSSESEKFALYSFDSEKGILGRQLHKSSEYDIIEAVVVGKHERPKKLPSEVDMGVKSGLLLCQNINITGMQSPENNLSPQVADRIEIIGIDSTLGVVKVEEDGSFLLRVSADMPFRIRTMNAEGTTINGPGSWYWLRPNERRGCTGCHEDHEIVPANRYAMAVSKKPVTIPVQISDIEEKEVELE